MHGVSSSRTDGSQSTTEADLSHKLQLAAYRRQTRLAMQRTSQLVPENTVAGNALTLVVAIMCFLACITLGAVTLINDAASDWQSDILREITIQVRPVDGADTATEAAKAATVARLFRGVASAEVVPESDGAALLEPWLGSDLELGDLPIPRLIVVRLSDPTVIDLEGLAARLAAQVQGASLDDHRVWTNRLQTMAGITVLIGLAILGLVFTATVLSVVFATRGAMAGNKDVVSVLHFVGAEDGFIAREFQRHFLLLGLKGGLAGAILAAILFAMLSFVVPVLLGETDSGEATALFGSFSVGPLAYLGALAIAFVIALMTAITSRITVYRYLAETS